MKKLILLSLSCIFFEFLNGQSNINFDCQKDSTHFLLMNKFLTGKSQSTLTDSLTYFRLVPSENDFACSIVVYAKLFDFLLLNGLDVNFDFSKNPSFRVSAVLIEPDPEFTEMLAVNAENARLLKMFQAFLHLKRQYERDIIEEFYSANPRQFELIVGALIKHGMYSYPKTVKDILLNKYSHLTSAKLGLEIRNGKQ